MTSNARITSKHLRPDELEAVHKSKISSHSHTRWIPILAARLDEARGELAAALGSMHHCNNEAIKAREEIARLRESRHDMERRRDAEAWAFDTEVGVNAALRERVVELEGYKARIYLDALDFGAAVCEAGGFEAGGDVVEAVRALREERDALKRGVT